MTTRSDEKNSQRDKSGTDKSMQFHSSPSKYESPSKKAHDSSEHKSKSSKMWLEFFDVNRINWCAFSKRSTLHRCFFFFFFCQKLIRMPDLLTRIIFCNIFFLSFFIGPSIKRPRHSRSSSTKKDLLRKLAIYQSYCNAQSKK